MLSQFINDDLIESDSFPPPSESSSFSLYSRLENFSTSDPSSTSTCADDDDYYGVYDRLRCGCKHGDSDGEIGQCMSLYLLWAKVAFGRVMKAYLSSPLCLAFVPLVVGAGIGFWMGRRSNHASSASDCNSDGKDGSTFVKKGASETKRMGENGLNGVWDTSFLFRVSQSFYWLSLQLALMFVFLDPRQRWRSIFNSNDMKLFQDDRDERTRAELRGAESKMESGVDVQCVPKHVAVIMVGFDFSLDF